MEKIDAICKKFSLHELENIKPLRDLAEKAGMKTAHLGLAIISFFFVVALFHFGSTVISFSIVFAYPAYMSYKAVEKKDNKNEEKLWLTYWVVFGFLHVVDDFLGVFLSILPFYTILRVILYVWLYHPKTKGALVFYNKVVKKMLKNYEEDIDSKLHAFQQKVDEVKPLLAKATEALKKDKPETHNIKDE